MQQKLKKKEIQKKNKLELKLDMSNSISSIKQLEGVIKSVSKNLQQLNTTDFTSNIIKGINEAKAQIKDFEKAVQQTKSKTINIVDKDSLGRSIPGKNSAIFTTFDSSKGLERKICVVFDFTEIFLHYFLYAILP